MRIPLLLISVAFIGSVFYFITNENELNSDKPKEAIPALFETSHATVQPTTITGASSQPKGQIQSNSATREKDTLLQDVQGQALMTAITSFWQQCRRESNCDELLAQQQLLLDDDRYLLLVNFPVNQQNEQRLMGASLISQDASLADKIATVKAIREQVWGDDAALLFQQQDAYYDYRLSLSDPDNRFNLAQNADDFINEYNAMLADQGEDLDSFALSSDTAKYEEALQLIPPSMPEDETARIKAKLASQYLTANERQSIVNREQQVDKQEQDITDYQQGLNELEVTLANERATSKKTMNDEDWQVYKAERLYQYRLNFFSL
ncbi:chromosome segregation ATPase [Moritella sp.]|uniref:chromosome segregation ATPase n=1 Tax=Moritella sp. TaxID=78556 RepID=UPI001DFAFF0C|nr:chromosome segregation ATPase [Moritella sp.]MCJ8351227.1 chromosome segregation ATPase [Moritella sp.]NQZ41367.1 chromosome segregation ATPase [Moritella sp.]